ncbi:nicotinic acid mononucleotide adenyltransferase [Cellulophaga sp. 20_2_10]|uniref:toxin-antitoxin system YwqK family antitoxin n=1 Tax=Cellulophaga sp. 20_2_10 TaxID=2942476 RepID=UPI00201ADBDA|nr:nicotinic acid mononucleotide adenyltransferase [Cellulophaga sp. 20_2_10]MCL5245573.1 nicotinic acid mononucleotide adenyltransferase [Cellulophaga sp. 20_2_10]
MKKTALIFAFIFSIALVNAQNTKPVFEKENNKVKATYYHTNGEVSQVGYFLDGKLDGEWTMFNVEGRKVAKGNYAEGKKVGKWFFWNDTALNEVDFEGSKIANVTKWKSEGTLVKN